MSDLPKSNASLPVILFILRCSPDHFFIYIKKRISAFTQFKNILERAFKNDADKHYL